MVALPHPAVIVPLALRVAVEQVAYWRSAGLTIAEMWAAIEYRHHGTENELLKVLADRWVDCLRWSRTAMTREAE